MNILVYLAFLIGLLIGSFLNVVIHRLPLGENLAVPGSHCPFCKHKIRPWENIPLVSYLVLKGKCASCGQGISVRYPAVELLTGVLFGGLAFQFGYTWETLMFMVFTAIMITVFFIDLDHFIIPDSLVVGVILLAIIRMVIFRQPTFVNGLVTGLIVFLFFYLVFILSQERFGGGDVKLFGALALFFGWPQINLIIILSSVTGVLVGGVMILAGKMKREEPIPFGPFIVLAALLIIFTGDALWIWYEKLMLDLLY